MLLSDDKKRYGMKDGGPGIEALRKEAPEVVKRMGYQDGNVVDSLNENPRTKMFGIETAINEAMLDLETAQKNNDARAIKTIGARINRLDKARIDIKNSLVENRQEFGFGGIVSKIYKLVGKSKPKNPTSKDIDEILNELTPAQMDKLTPIEKEQLLDMDLAKSGVDNIPTTDIDDALNKLTPAQMDKLTPIEREQLLDMDLEKYGIDGRKSKMTGGLLSDDRQQYGVGKIVAKAFDKAMQKIPGGDVLYDKAELALMKKKKLSLAEEIKLTEDLYKDSVRTYTDLNKSLKKATSLDEEEAIREMMEDESNIITRLGRQLKQMGVEPSYKNFKEEIKIPRGGKAEGGMLEESDTMKSDEVMEDEYLDFILDEALDSEEENFLMDELQSNDKLSMIFDKVIDVAQEFAGSGPVEGPGSGVSDSIPARLSDGEFVFTAKAVEEIGADNLMAMMKDAEMKADGRQDLAEGGQPEEEETVEMEVEKPTSRQDIRVVKTTVDNGGKSLMDEDEISKSIKSKMMLDNRTGRHVQS